MLLLDAFRVHALHSPGNVVVVDPCSGEEFVYRQIWNASELLGAHLIEQTAEGRLVAGEPVAIVGGAQPLACACVIACAKSSHPYYFAEDVQSTAPSRVVLAANKVTATLAKEHLGDDTLVLDAELMLSYIVPGMTDDFSCGCGAEDCSHGPFLQECMPSEWFGVEGVFCVGAVGAVGAQGVEMTVVAHDEMLTQALMGDNSFANGSDDGGGGLGGRDRPPDDLNRTSSAFPKKAPLNLCNPHLAVALATGATIVLE